MQIVSHVTPNLIADLHNFTKNNQSPKPNQVILLPEPNPSATLARFISFI